ncbi:AcrR family transcriptional regulator [Lipingzhangella halophila]|uniref:AcrR family transcriptional regulator n=1 Tax=Lipingzhangella halophila TaxID=1783352 RepID=A0A7W7RI90_9ACTN|nr:TetR/AcrR family transcriptional regulator [Lipingzhangella halophila]MBB4932470.1 AcrR family transcriptional regulator [Lipingzhangella halophila]
MGTRDRILDAAADIMRTDGVARATTKEIAKRAGFSEAALYKHFTDKPEIFVAVLHERLPQLAATLQRLQNQVGEGSVRGNLEDVVAAALAFYDESFPMLVGIFAERRLLEAHREGVRRLGAGPEYPNQALSAYLRAEQRHGRVRGEVDPNEVASLLFGACLQHAFFRHFSGAPEPAGAQNTASALVSVVAGGIEPAR